MDYRRLAPLLVLLILVLLPASGLAGSQDSPDWLDTRERIVIELRGARKRVPPHLLEPANLDSLLQHVLETYKNGYYQGQLPDSRSARRSLASEAADILEDHSEDLEDLAELENALRPFYPLLGADPASLPGWPAMREAVLAKLDEDTPDPAAFDPDLAGLDALILQEARKWNTEVEAFAEARNQARVVRRVPEFYAELLILRQRVQSTRALWPAPPVLAEDDYQPVADPDWASLREKVPAAAKLLNGDPVYSFLDARVVDELLREVIERRHDGQIPDDLWARERLVASVGYDYRTGYMLSLPALQRLEARVRERFANPLIAQHENGMVVVNLGLAPGAVVPGRADVHGPMTEVPIIPVIDPTVFRVGALLQAYRDRYPQAEPLGLVVEFYRGRSEEAQAYFHFQRGDRIILVEETGGRSSIRYRVSPELGGLAQVVDGDGELQVQDWILVNPPHRRIQRDMGEAWHRPAPPWVYRVLRELDDHLWAR